MRLDPASEADPNIHALSLHTRSSASVLIREMTQDQTGWLLREHARTFSLTLRLLPPALRGSLGTAYLLARASDTVADCGAIPRARRVALLEDLQGALEGNRPSGWGPEIPQGSLPDADLRLLAGIPTLTAELERHPDRAELTGLWRTILKGQLFDLRRFPSAEPLSRGELELYCGLVAGSVGETWTRLVERHSPGVLQRAVAEMIPLGRDYGRGLQLVNILRDRSEDRSIGRIYACDAELPGLFDLAGVWLSGGEEYLSLLRPGRVLQASGLPLDLAVRTLEGVRRSPDARRVSLGRPVVYAVLAGSVSSLCFPRRFNRGS